MSENYKLKINHIRMHKAVPIVVACVVVGGAAFFGGMKYGESKSVPNPEGGNRGQFGGGAGGVGARRAGAGAGTGVGARMGGGNFIGGEIIAKDDKSVTVKLQDGGSKIIFFSGSTKVLTSVEGKPEDLKVGSNIMATGDTNTDGSITAKSIQTRPDFGGQAATSSFQK